MEHSPRDSFHLLWMIAIIFCAVAGLFSAIFASCSRGGASPGKTAITAAATPASAGTVTAASGEPAAETPVPAAEETQVPDETEETPEPTAEPTPTPIPEGVVLESTTDMGQSYIDRFVVLGDSTTYGLAAYSILPNAQVWVTGDASLPLYTQSYANINFYSSNGSMQQMNIDSAVSQRQPEFLLISLGLDSVATMEEEDFKAEYTDLVTRVHELSPNTKIICQSIYPVIDDQVSGALKNNRLSTANGWIIGVAAETGNRYLDVQEVLTDDSGNLRQDYTNGDGIHLNEDAFDQVIQYIRTHGYLN